MWPGSFRYSTDAGTRLRGRRPGPSTGRQWARCGFNRIRSNPRFSQVALRLARDEMMDYEEYLDGIKANLLAGRMQWRRGDKVLTVFGYVRRRQTFVDLINSEL